MRENNKKPNNGLETSGEIVSKRLEEEDREKQEYATERLREAVDKIGEDINQNGVPYILNTEVPPVAKEKEEEIIGERKAGSLPVYGEGVRKCEGYVYKNMSGKCNKRFAEDFLRKAAITDQKDAREISEKSNASLLVKYPEKPKRREDSFEEVKRGDLIKGDENPEERIIQLNISYQSEVYPENSRIMNIEDKKEEANKRHMTQIMLLANEKVVEDILEGIKVKPENFWETINKIEPNLLEVVPPREESIYGAQSLLIRKEGEGEEILEWSKEEDTHEIPEPPRDPETPSPEEKVISDKAWREQFLEGEVSKDAEEMLENKFDGFIKIGKSGLRTETGEINGPLVWVDDEASFGVFETPEGRIMLPLEEVLNSQGIPYKEAKRRRRESRRDEERREREQYE